MADHTSIEWTDATWNPITGCSVVSPGCTNCYAMKLAGTRLRHHPSRAGLTRESKAGPVWTDEVRLNSEWLDQPLRWKRSRRIFVCAHGDLFAEGVPDAWIDQVFAVMALAPQHTFQVLTKRPARMRQYLSTDPDLLRDRWYRSVPAGKWYVSVAEAYAGMHPHASDEIRALHHRAPPAWPLPNVWLGISAEDQARADGRVSDLLATPAAIRFVSAEPLLGPIDFTGICTGHYFIDALGGAKYHDAPEGERSARQRCAKLDQIIVGGESGAAARPMHPAWVRSIRDQCAAAYTAFFFKQWGEWAPNIGAVDGWTIDDDPEISRFEHREWEDGHWSEPFFPMWCDWQDGNYDEEHCVSRIGKRRAGRLLDGVEHNAMPTMREVPFR